MNSLTFFLEGFTCLCMLLQPAAYVEKMSATEKLENQLSMVVKSIEGLQETSTDNQRVLSFLLEWMKIDTQVKKDRKSKFGSSVDHDEDSQRPDSEVTLNLK